MKELRSALHQVKLVYDSSAVEDVVFDARRVADTDATVLITGESGTGKELIARTIHQVSPPPRARSRRQLRRDPENLLESELFGHERAPSRARCSRNPGRFEQADGGTLFLDEVGECPLDVQAKLLRSLEERAVHERVGGTQDHPRRRARDRRDQPGPREHRVAGRRASGWTSTTG